MFPQTRMRRMRNDRFSRLLMRKHTLSPSDLVYPVFVCEGTSQNQPILTMPGISRLSTDRLLYEAENILSCGIPAIALFPVISQHNKSEDARAAYHPHGLIQQTTSAIKQRFPELGVITDVALDPYTIHGQDGITSEKGHVLNDETVDILVKQALSHAHSGADIVAPSDMMDGRIGCIRQSLEKEGFIHTRILSYAVKYCSSFYRPFRDAVKSRSDGTEADKSSYQIDCASSSDEALREALLDEKEGADILMIKPAMPYLDVLAKIAKRTLFPLWAYQVSGEYSMIKMAAGAGCFTERDAVVESLTGIKRAGGNVIITYFAKKVARWLKEDGH